MDKQTEIILEQKIEKAKEFKYLGDTKAYIKERVEIENIIFHLSRTLRIRHD